MKYFSRIYLSFFLLISGQLAGGYTTRTFTATANSDEFIYLHTDRSYYFPGETIHFKAYILDGRDQINDTLHIALIDQEGFITAYKVLPLNNSLISDNIDLPEFMNEGAYILVASTRYTANSPGKMFSKVIDIINPDSELNTSVTFSDSLYKPGGLVKARIRLSGRKNNAVSSGFSYRMTGTNGEILNGDGKTDKTGMTTIELSLPEFDENETLKLIITPHKKKSKSSAGIVIPTKFNTSTAKSDGKSGNLRKIKISIITNRLPRNENAEVEISVTDEKGIPVIANLSVSASAILTTEASSANDDIVSYLSMNLPPADFRSVSSAGTVFNSQVTEYFAKALIQTIQYPGKVFLVWQKDKKKAGRMKEPLLRQEGYTSDRDIYDILMQIKPYHLENNMIVFGLQSIYSINNPGGAIIVVDGIKMGTDASILGTIPVPDIANISVSTSPLDIQRYSALNTVGVIEITMKKSKEFLNIQDPPSKTNTLFWGPNLITDSSGKIFLSFSCNEIKDVLISVNGISAEGLPGSSSVNFQAR
jgi:hypothetical protein